jgi:hypothetical protein
MLDEAHNSAYPIHPGTTKMYLDLKTRYWWRGMKKEIAQCWDHASSPKVLQKETALAKAAHT